MYEYSQSIYLFANIFFLRFLILDDLATFFILDWWQAFFGEILLLKSIAAQSLWILIYSLTIQNLWIACNFMVYQQVQRPSSQVAQLIQKGLMKYGRATWLKCYTTITQHPSSTTKTLVCFDAFWASSPIFCQHEGMHFIWTHLHLVTRVGQTMVGAFWGLGSWLSLSHIVFVMALAFFLLSLMQCSKASIFPKIKKIKSMGMSFKN